MIRYVEGDATDPQDPNEHAPWGRVIVHCCNDEGAWGSGFVKAVSARWPQPERVYRLGIRPAALGEVQFVPVDWSFGCEIVNPTDRELRRAQWVCNLIGQHETIRTNPHPIKYDAIYEGLVKVNKFCTTPGTNSTLHMPRMGAGLAGGSWAVIEAIINEACPMLDVTVYDLPNNPIPIKE